MQQRRGLKYLIMVLIAVVAPTVIALGWYEVSKNPSLRPLGITKQALSAYNGEGAAIEIVAVVDWAPNTGQFTQAQLARDIATSFAAKGVDVRISFRDGAGGTQITYLVGKSVLGPYPTTRAAEGIAAAVEAYKMH